MNSYKPATQRFRDFMIPDDDASPHREAPADDAVSKHLPFTREWLLGTFTLNGVDADQIMLAMNAVLAADRQSRVPDGQPLFQHYKGGCYRYVCQAKREDDGVLLAVYQSESHEDQYAIYVRPHDEFDAKFTEVAAPKGPSE